MDETSRVFVTQPNRRWRNGVLEEMAPIARIAPWGERVYIFEDKQRIFDAAVAWENVALRLDALDYDAEKDYLVVTGDLVLAMLTFYEMICRAGKVRLLRYDDRREDYHLLVFNLPPEKDEV